jgi:hypothetical protein
MAVRAPARSVRRRGKEVATRSITDHFAHHRSHLLGCVAAGALVLAAIVFELPVLAIFGALFCAAMMIGMVWMMYAMGSKDH